MKEHVGKERQIVGGASVDVAKGKGSEIPGWNQSKSADE
jgi:hypothetical protein